MHRARRTTLLLLILFASWAGPAASQAVEARVPAEGEIQELVMQNGSTLFGRVTREGDPFLFQLLSGQTIEVRTAEIARLSTVRGEAVNGRFYREDPNQTRLFFGPTARMVGQGKGYISVFELIMPFVAIGLHDRITIAGGTPLVFGGDEGDRIFWFAPKIGVLQRENLAVAAGVLAFGGLGSTESLGILYGVVSMGGAHIAVGYGYEGGDLASRPALMLGVERRVSNGVKLLSENYLIEDGAIVSGGVRFFGERLSADLGLAMPFFDEGSVAIPVVNFVWNW
jgi:hypothetical protein